MKIKSYILSLVLVLTIFLIKCDSLPLGEDSNDNKWKPWAKTPPPAVELTLDISSKKISQDSTVDLTLRIHNPNEDSVEFIVSGGGSYYNYDFVVTRPDSTYVWSLRGNTLTMGDFNVEMAPGETKISNAKWNLNYFTDDGKENTKVEEGEYLIWGGLRSVLNYDSNANKYTDIGDIGTGPTEITVK